MVTRGVLMLVFMVALGCGNTRALDIEEDKLDSGVEYVIGIASKKGLETVGVYVVTGEKDANVTIYLESVTETFVPSFSVEYVVIPRTFLTSEGRTLIEDKSISIIVNSNEVSISLSRDFDRLPLFPLSGLGRKYVVPSHSRAFVVATHSNRTQVNVTVGVEGWFNYNGNTYTYGDTLSVNLDSYQTLTVYGYPELTGTIITSDEIIAVFIEYVFPQMIGENSFILKEYYNQHLPNEQLGQEFVVSLPLHEDETEFELQIFSEQNSTQIEFNDGTTEFVNTNGIYSRPVIANKPLQFNTSQPVFTTLIINNMPRIVPPVKLFTNSIPVYTDRFVVLTTTDAMLYVRSSTSVLKENSIQKIPDTNYMVVEYVYTQAAYPDYPVIAINCTNARFVVVSEYGRWWYGTCLVGCTFQITSTTSVTTATTHSRLTTATSSSSSSSVSIWQTFQYALVCLHLQWLWLIT